MGTSYVINVFILLIVFLSWTPGLSAYRPSGYLGCYNDLRSPYRNLNRTYRISETNTGDKCKRYCSSGGYRYAGTESAEECLCGNVIRYENLTDGCNHRCPGNLDEICGGHYRINIYDTWQKTLSTTLQQKTRTLQQMTTSLSATTTMAPHSSVVAETGTSYFILSENMAKENEHRTHTEVYISIPATVAIVGIIAVVALWIIRRSGGWKHHLSSGAGRINQSTMVTGTEAELKKDDDNVNVDLYDDCDAADCVNKFYKTPIMNTTVSYNDRNHETQCNSLYLQPVSSTSDAQTGGEDYHYIDIGETEKWCKQV